MPFTLSHSAVVIPILRSKYFSATGLIIGTMAPDFEYFFRMNVRGIYGHTLWGILYFDVPVGLLLALLFHRVAKKNLIDNLPVFLQARFQDVRNLDFTTYLKSHKLIFIISLILGTVTHILWDGFTHERQFFVRALPELYEHKYIPFMGAKYPLWYGLQLISTAVGALIIGLYVLTIKPLNDTLYKPQARYWILLTVIIAVVMLIRMLFGYGNLWYVVAVITFCSAFCIGITILGFVPFRKPRL